MSTELSSFHQHLGEDLKSSFASYPKIYNLGHKAEKYPCVRIHVEALGKKFSFDLTVKDIHNAIHNAGNL